MGLRRLAEKLSTKALFEIAGIKPLDLDNLLSKIEERSSDECWPWVGCKRNGGYGNWAGGDPRKNMYPHRIALAIRLGRPLAQRALHKCDNRNCCNPHHLFEGTQAENIQDAVAKGRWEGRTSGGSAKITQVIADEIRALLADGKMSGASIARKYGIAPSAIVSIRKGRTWKGIDRRYGRRDGSVDDAGRRPPEISDEGLRRTLESVDGVIAHAAPLLRLSMTTVWRRVKKLGAL